MANADFTARVCRCPVCVTAAESGDAYFLRSFVARRDASLLAESIADAFGYCRRHGARLLTCTAPAPVIADVFRAAVGRVQPMVGADLVRGDQFWQAYFGARDACPACAHEQRAISRHVGRLARSHACAPDSATVSTPDSVCVVHLRRIAGELNPARRMPFLAECLDRMDQAHAILEALSAGAADRNGELPAGRAQELRMAINLVAGGAWTNPAWLGEEPSDSDGRHHLAGTATNAEHCPVCAAMEQAAQRWVQSAQEAERHQVEGWLLYPTCPDHIATVCSLGRRPLVLAVMANALRGAIPQVQHEIRLLVRAAETQEELAAVRIARWGKRRRRKAVEPRLTAPRPRNCPACERLAHAETKAVGDLLEELAREEARDRYCRGYGLCMKHFAQASLIAPRGVIRHTLSTHQQARLAEDALAFEAVARDGAASAGDAQQSPRYRAALHRFAGFAGCDSPPPAASPP